MEVGLVRQIDIDAEMQQSYLDYAMSVIVARALPDAQDGLKPVHRRILYAMHAMGIRPTTDLKKSARIVGEVLGKFHPHGDMAVYEAMARMAQPFSMRYPLVDGQGNFGSVDGDPPAAMRYTEARLAPLSMELLAGIEKDTVDFIDNFDGSLEEPVVLPTAIPNLLLNGATGIAVGMATSIPPHNMGEVCDALVYMLDNWTHLDQISVDDLMRFIQGPDFPTGGIIVREPGEREGLTAAYGSGRGKVIVQARAHVEDMGRGRSRILVTELPYLTNKASLIERIAELARAGQLEGLADLRDESDRQGLRIVIELTKTAEPEKVLAELYRRTPMQTTFGINMLALVEGEPRLLNLKQALRVYLEHRLVVVQRRSEFDLARARERAHVLEGLRIALAHLDEVIQMIRGASDADQAQARLMRRYRLSEVQARAILDMPLRRLAGLERKKIDQEHKETMARIKDLEALLASEKKMRALVAEELTELKAQYGDRRRTQIAQARKGKRGAPLLTATDLALDKDTWVVVTSDGLISRTPTARLPRLAGRSAPVLILGARGRDTLYLFDTAGDGAALAVHTLPEVDDPKDGSPLAGSTPFPPEAHVVAGVAIAPDRGPGQGCLFFCTRGAMVKRIMLDALPGPSAKLFTGMNVGGDDALGWVRVTSGSDEVVLVNSAGLAIRFAEAEVRPTGLAAGGVLGMRMEAEGTRVVAMDTARPQSELLLLSEDGHAKRTPLAQFPTQGRHGKGVRAWKSAGEARLAGAAVGIGEDRSVAHLARAAAHSLRFADAPRRSRGAAGKTAFEVKAGDRVTEVAGIVARAAFKPPEARPVPEPPAKKRKAAGREPASKGKRSKAKSVRTAKKATKRGARTPKKNPRRASKAVGRRK